MNLKTPTGRKERLASPAAGQGRKIGIAIFAVLCLAAAGCGSTPSTAEGQGSAAAQQPGSQEPTEGPPTSIAGSDDPESVPCGQIQVGLIGPLTGPNSDFGNGAENSAIMALEKYNKEHPKCKVELVKFDTQGSPEKAPAAATKAVNTPQIVAVLGPEFSGEVESGTPILEDAGMPMITSIGTSVALASRGWSVFHRTIGDDGVEAPGEAQYVVKDLGIDSVAVINNGESYGAGAAKAFSQALKQLGGKVALTAKVEPSVSDYSSTVIAIQGSNAKAVFCGCLYPEAARLLKQLRQHDVKLPFVTGSGSIEPSFAKIAGAAAAKGAIAGNAAALPQASADTKKFYDEYVTRFGPDAGHTFAAEGYDAATAIFKAIADGNHSRQTINKYLDQIDFKGVTGTVKFMPNGNRATGTVSILKCDGDGTWQYLTKVDVPDSLRIRG